MPTLGPGDGSLTVRTGRAGAIKKVGHDLVIEVTSWEATLDDASLALTADSRSLRVVEGTGGMTSLGDEERSSIRQSIDEEVLKGGTIEYRSTSVTRDGDALHVEGELDLLGERRPLALELLHEGGRLTGGVAFRQSDWGMKPFSTLFGTLKVADEVRVAIDVQVQSL
jgi:polyisoprenoid-binding protein YceI